MRAAKRLAVLAALCLAVTLGVTLRTTSAQDTPAAKRGMIATVDVVTLLEEALQTDEYRVPRDALYQKMDDEIQQGQNQLISMQNQIRSMDPADPQTNQLYGQYQQLVQQLEASSQAKAAEYDQAGAAQAVAIFNRVRAASSTAGDRLGYEYVMASRSSDATMGEAAGLTAVTQQILARPVLAGAEHDDITAAVRAELGLPEPTGDEDADASGAADAPATDDNG
ncbi:MAG: hypothetical protein DHS20C14_22490 [Phycisphaeraceae bacterium]|nr:MAG: hypothetical protein DHS20C14_22490 [Phycisphaeraceae bacterium]